MLKMHNRKKSYPADIIVITIEDSRFANVEVWAI